MTKLAANNKVTLTVLSMINTVEKTIMAKAGKEVMTVVCWVYKRPSERASVKKKESMKHSEKLHFSLLLVVQSGEIQRYSKVF